MRGVLEGEAVQRRIDVHVPIHAGKVFAKLIIRVGVVEEVRMMDRHLIVGHVLR